MRDYLRGLPVFTGVLAGFDTGAVPAEPGELFADWLREAVGAGVREPHAMTVSTSGPEGPDARVLILKDVDEHGWWFATSATSAKGRQLADDPRAALTFYWVEVARQVRVRGGVVAGTREQSAADFRARGTSARAVALASSGSRPLADRDTGLRAVHDADLRLANDPTLVEESWTVYAVRPDSVEFWQADKDRMHHRLRYEAHGAGWQRTLLWP
jgi:pyridoxamine 5'-phosphate oxidase